MNNIVGALHQASSLGGCVDVVWCWRCVCLVYGRSVNIVVTLRFVDVAELRGLGRARPLTGT